MSSRPICETPSKLVPANGAPLSVLILAILPHRCFAIQEGAGHRPARSREKFRQEELSRLGT